MLIAVGAQTFGEALEWTAEVYRTAGELLRESGLLAGVADEGGWWPQYSSNEEALEWSVRAIEAAGFKPGQDLAISLDVAASEFGQSGSYRLSRDQRRVPMFNVEKNQTLAAMDKVEALVSETGATFWIEHDAALFETLKLAPNFYR